MKRIAAIDERAFMWIASHHRTQPGRRLPKLFHSISKSADGHLYPVLLALMFFVDNTHGLLLFYTALVAYTLELPLYLMLRHIFKRPRPCNLIMYLEAFVVPGDKFSLPSGHTAAAFLMATIVGYLYPITIIPGFIWASAVGLSRIVLRVHFPIDVILGASLGATIALITIKVLE